MFPSKHVCVLSEKSVIDLLFLFQKRGVISFKKSREENISTRGNVKCFVPQNDQSAKRFSKRLSLSASALLYSTVVMVVCGGQASLWALQ